ncbi:MAG: nitroreductase family protein [Halieaceae bacterium]|jgi:nitroreductase|nr:nitroreductase family protein [Halieaceae bacterium]
MNAIDLLRTRTSHARLTEPGPSDVELKQILEAGLRAPDYGHLRPWEFVVVSGERRQALGDIFAESQILKGCEDEAVLKKARNALLRAPVVIAGVLRAKDSDKVSRTEQAAAVACALYGMSLASNALGFGAVWRTGPYSTDPHVLSALGAAPGDEVIGYLYVGTKEGPTKVIPDTPVDDYVRYY